MTSAPNRQLRLSGNKGNGYLWVLIVAILALSSCKGWRNGERYDNGNAATVINTSGVDTLTWGDTPDASPPIGDSGSPAGTIPEEVIPPVTPPVKPPEPPGEEPPTPEIPATPTDRAYKIAYLLPFYANKATGGIKSKSSIKSLEFYTGAKIAMEQLEQEGLNAKIYAYDTKGSANITNRLVQRSEFRNMDLVFGPMKTDALRTAAAKVRGTKTALVSPWNPKTNITSSNPNYIQVSPSLQTHCEALMAHVHQHHDINDVVLVARKGTTERNHFRYFQDANKVLSNNISVPRIPEMTAEYGDNIPVQSYFRPDSTIFIVPSWDEAFISNFLRQLALMKGNRKIVVYGLPQWREFSRIDFDYYERLNIRVSSAAFVDTEDEKVRDFRRDYFNRTGAVPGEDAFLGYDLTLFFGRQLKEKGSSFLRSLDQERTYDGDYYHTNFRFEALYPYGDDRFENTNRFENQYLNILYFDDFRFHRK